MLIRSTANRPVGQLPVEHRAATEERSGICKTAVIISPDSPRPHRFLRPCDARPPVDDGFPAPFPIAGFSLPIPPLDPCNPGRAHALSLPPPYPSGGDRHRMRIPERQNAAHHRDRQQPGHAGDGTPQHGVRGRQPRPGTALGRVARKRTPHARHVRRRGRKRLLRYRHRGHLRSPHLGAQRLDRVHRLPDDRISPTRATGLRPGRSARPGPHRPHRRRLAPRPAVLRRVHHDLLQHKDVRRSRPLHAGAALLDPDPRTGLRPAQA